MRLAALWLCAAVAVLVPTPGAAQVAGVLLSEGITAYNDLEFAAAAQLFRRALAPEARPPLADTDRRRALMYLGAAELLGGDRSRAVEAFRSLLLENPRFRPDSLLFPPRVTQVVEEVAQTTKAVAVEAPREHGFIAGERTFTIRVHATSPHLVRAGVWREGAMRRSIYEGPIIDSLVLVWDGLGGDGAAVGSGDYVLEVASMVTSGSVLRAVRVPLAIRAQPRDTLPWPQALPQPGKPIDIRFLVPGVALGAALALPALLGDVSGEGTRITLGVALFGVGVAGAFLASRPPQPGVDQQRLSEVHRENARRRTHPRLVVRAGPPRRVEGGGQ